MTATVLAALTQAVLDGAVAAGLDGDALRAGLDPSWLADPDARVPLGAHLALWAAVSAHPIGLDLGAHLGLAGLGVVGYALQHGATAGEALDLLQRMRAVVHPDVVPRVERREGRVVFVQAVPPAFARLREPVDAQAAATVAAMRALTGTPVRPIAVALPLARPADPRRHDAHFGCPVAWGAPALEIAFDASLLALPLPRSDARLYGYLARRAAGLLADLPATASFAERSRREIGGLLARGDASLTAVARALGVSDRTLHRRLRDEGTGFAALLDEARRERALLLLDDPALSASEVAFLLGFTEPAGFFRAFRRWTGDTPQRHRARARQDS